MSAGPLALVVGDELKPGNEPQDRVLVETAGEGPAFVLATAAARHRPHLVVRNAEAWFGSLGLEVEELPATSRAAVRSPANLHRARSGRCFYLVGGDPGLVPKTLSGSPLWEAVLGAWRDGAALAGSSAGAMALGSWTLIRGRYRGDARRRYAEALDVVRGIAVLPHFDTFGHRWLPSATAAMPREDVVLVGVDERSAAVWHEGVWRAMGDGSVTVIAGGRTERFDAGETIEGIPQPVSAPSSPD
jgi:cyanophycinase